MKKRRSMILMSIALVLALGACNLPPQALGQEPANPQAAVETVVAATLTAESAAAPTSGIYLPAIQSSGATEPAASPQTEATAAPAATAEPTATPEPTPVPTEEPAAYQSYPLEEEGDQVSALAVDTLGIYFVSEKDPQRLHRLGFDGASFETLADLSDTERVIQGRILANGYWLIYLETLPDASARNFGLHAVYLPTAQDFPLIASYGEQMTDPLSVEYALEGSNLLVTRCDWGADLAEYSSCQADIFYLENGGQVILAQSNLSTGGVYSNPGLSGEQALWLEGAADGAESGAKVHAVNIYTYLAGEFGLEAEPVRLTASSGYLLYGTAQDGAPVDRLASLTETGESELPWPADVSKRAQLGPSVAAGASESGEWRVFYSRAGAAPAALAGSGTPGEIRLVDIADEWLAWASTEADSTGSLHWMALPGE